MKWLTVAAVAVIVELVVAVAVGRWFDDGDDDDQIYARLVRAGAWQ